MLLGRMNRKKASPKDIKKKVFGVKLDARATQVPVYLELWLSILETDLSAEGLFRVNGSSSNMSKIRNAIESGIEVDYRLFTPHDIAGMVKMYLRELPTPLIPLELYDCFIATALTENSDAFIAKLQKAVRLLPPGHKCTIFRLSKFFGAVTAHSAENKMSSDNLSTVFAPSLFRHPLEATNIELVVADFALQIKIIHTIITNHSAVFKGYIPGQASEETLEKVVNFKKKIEEQYAFGVGPQGHPFNFKMKRRYETYRVMVQQQPTQPARVISEKYERIKTGAMTYEETQQLLNLIFMHWHTANSPLKQPRTA